MEERLRLEQTRPCKNEHAIRLRLASSKPRTNAQISWASFGARKMAPCRKHSFTFRNLNRPHASSAPKSLYYQPFADCSPPAALAERGTREEESYHWLATISEVPVAGMIAPTFMRAFTAFMDRVSLPSLVAC